MNIVFTFQSCKVYKGIISSHLRWKVQHTIIVPYNIKVVGYIQNLKQIYIIVVGYSMVSQHSCLASLDLHHVKLLTYTSGEFFNGMSHITPNWDNNNMEKHSVQWWQYQPNQREA